MGVRIPPPLPEKRGQKALGKRCEQGISRAKRRIPEERARPKNG